MCRAFLRLVGSGIVAVIVNVNTWGMVATMPVGTSYFISKLALGRLSEAIPLAYPKVSSMNYHPGMIYTDMARASSRNSPFLRGHRYVNRTAVSDCASFTKFNNS